MKRILLSTSMCALAISLCFAGNAAADPDPSQIHITDIQYNGSGCPPDSAVIDLAPDGQAFTVIYSQYAAEIGPGLPLSASRRNCQLNLMIHVPQGFTY